MTVEFQPSPKIPRLKKEVTITEKIDGTNAQIMITECGDFFVGSRNRLLTPESDNFGFCNWAMANKEDLLKLGPGRHYGEWWGHGIQRGYGLSKGERYFSLFNVTLQDIPDCCRLVPVLNTEPATLNDVEWYSYLLISDGSKAAPGFMNPEGVMVYHSGLGGYLKYPFDSQPKGSTQPANYDCPLLAS